MCKVININHFGQKWDHYCGRAGKGYSGEFGNHFVVGKDGKRGGA